MSLQLTWPEIILRLILTVMAGALIGANREGHDRPAGLRTTVLVCLAASVSMIQVNLLLGMNGKSPSSFVVMDLMRLPLGILSGMGFIGGGAILRKDNMVRGVTTAATLWFVTVIGLCLGGGQLVLGMIATALGLVVLSGFKVIEQKWQEDRRGILTIISDDRGPDEVEIGRHIASMGCRAAGWTNLSYRHEDGYRERSCQVIWRSSRDDPRPPEFIKPLSELPGIRQVDWKL